MEWVLEWVSGVEGGGALRVIFGNGLRAEAALDIFEKNSNSTPYVHVICRYGVLLVILFGGIYVSICAF